MKIKVCYNHEIHRLAKVPDTLEGLLQLVSTIFHAQLPDAWCLQYTDSDGDNIRIASEKDYDEFKNAEQASTVISKVHVVAIGDAKQPEIAEEVIVIENDNKEDEEYQVIQSEEKKVIAPQVEAAEVKEEVVIEKQEEPVELKEEQIKEPVEKQEKKVYVDMETLEKLVSMMIEKSLPKISEFTQQQIEKQKASELQGLLSNDDSFLDQPSQPLKMPHYGVSCDGCAMSPVMGIRYKCEKCPNFDLCEKCEGEGKHSHHNFIKIKEHSFLSSVRPVVSNKESESFFKPEIYFEMRELKKEEPREERRGNSSESIPTAEEIAYYDNLVEKVRKLMKVFPNINFDLTCAFVNDAPEDLSLEELIENFKH